MTPAYLYIPKMNTVETRMGRDEETEKESGMHKILEAVK
jgi:hypothetical protein